MDFDFSNILKICSKCHRELPLSEYHKEKKGKYGVRSLCKQCRASENVMNRDKIYAYNVVYRVEHHNTMLKQMREYNKNKRAEYSQIEHVIDQFAHKVCGTCGISKQVTEFSLNRSNPDGLQHRCKQCISNHYIDNSDHVKNRVKQWRLRNIDYVKQEKHDYYLSKREYILQIRKYYYLTHRDYYIALQNERKRRLGYAPMNQWFKGSEYHHLITDLNGNTDNAIGLYIPKELHRSVWHNGKTGYNMDVINKLALEWYESNKSVIVSD